MDDLEDLERAMADLVDPATEPRDRECLAHYLDRMLTAHGCERHRFTRLWASRRTRPNTQSLLSWASKTGGCCCDCEVMMNSLRRSAARTRAGVLCEASLPWQQSLASCWFDDQEEAEWPEQCSGVRGTVARSVKSDLSLFDEPG